MSKLLPRRLSPITRCVIAGATALIVGIIVGKGILSVQVPSNSHYFWIAYIGAAVGAQLLGVVSAILTFVFVMEKAFKD